MEGAISFIGKKGNCASLNKKQAGRHSNVKKKACFWQRVAGLPSPNQQSLNKQASPFVSGFYWALKLFLPELNCAIQPCLPQESLALILN
jgi:hypothetical protein